MIKLVNVSKNFKRNHILADINITFEDGHAYYIKGINGSGKSVLLKLISGYLKPSEGEIYIDAEKLGDKTEFIGNAGLFINAPEMLSSLSGKENLDYLGSIRKRVDIAYRDELIRKLELEKDINKRYGTYSQGMKQKIRIIQALMEKPKYLILDEPLNALDERSRNQVIEILNSYLKDHPDSVLIYTSHEYSSNDALGGITMEVKENHLVAL